VAWQSCVIDTGSNNELMILDLQRVIVIDGRMYMSPHRAALLVGASDKALRRCARRAATWYGASLDVVKHGGHSLIEERDVLVLAEVNQKFPVGNGPLPRIRREEMRAYAERVRAKLTPAPSQ
jgi:hypothetical protein